jgi:2-polyprenyl-6-methoxyphenol hydroxylase-like FAD-dependent oxidoreductase
MQVAIIGGGNGASQALHDARVLARELATQPTIEAGVAACSFSGDI